MAGGRSGGREGRATPSLPGKALILWAEGSCDLAARRAAEGAIVLAVDERAARALEKAGVSHRRTSADHTIDGPDPAVRTWTRVWGRLPLVDGLSFRELAEWKGVSLWWMGEAFFRTATEAPRCVSVAESFLRLLEAEDPAEVEAVGLSTNDALLLSRACTVKGVLYHGPASARPRTHPSAWEWQGRREAWGAFLHGLRGGRPSGAPGVVALVVEPGAESGGASALAASFGSEAQSVSLPDLLACASRPARALAGEGRSRLRDLWRQLRDSPGVHQSFTHRGVGFFDLAGADLAGLLLARLPAAVRLYEAAAEWLRRTRPAALVLVIPSRDDRRTLLAAASAAGVLSIVLRPGNGDEGERADGGPQADHVLSGEAASDPGQVRSLVAARGRVGGP
jgi:hypothetical protein